MKSLLIYLIIVICFLGLTVMPSQAREATATLLVRLWVVPDMSMTYEDSGLFQEFTQAARSLEMNCAEGEPAFLGSTFTNNTYICRQFDADSNSLIITQTEI